MKNRPFQTLLDDKVEDFFSAIANGTDLLRFLTGPKAKEMYVVDQTDELGISRTTYYRKKKALKEAGVIESDTGNYSLTPEAQDILNRVKSYQAKQAFRNAQVDTVRIQSFTLQPMDSFPGFLTTYTEDDVAHKKESIPNVFTEEHHIIDRKQSGCIPNTGIAETILSHHYDNICGDQEFVGSKILSNAILGSHTDKDTKKLASGTVSENQVKDTLSELRQTNLLSYDDHSRSYKMPGRGKRIYQNYQNALIKTVRDMNLESWITSYKDNDNILRPVHNL